MRLGIIKLSALGDIVVAMSFLPILKEKGYSIDWFVDQRFEEILQNSPYINTIYSLPLKQSLKNKNFKSLMHHLRHLQNLQPYDLLIDMQGLIKSAILGKFIPSKCFRGFGFSSCKESISAFFYQEKINIAYQENILKRNAKILSLENPNHNLHPFGFTQAAQQKITSLLQTPYKKVLLLIEASRPQKMYPIDHLITLCQSLKDESIAFFVLYYAYQQKAQDLCSQSQAILLPKLNLDEVKALIANIDCVIGGDTGITHLAWAMNKPSITLYGNTPIERFRLKGEKNISLSGNAYANYKHNDFSIAKISPLEIKKHLLEIL